ncbi:hypothetical protein V6N11_060140 [Hibiscus sabdariffa]|uniref:Uncharacterized protein n=1 Tax=Hibiscus sabdariffa TaxID=183260 RepID=A0ABR2P395_9ROSI
MDGGASFFQRHRAKSRFGVFWLSPVNLERRKEKRKCDECVDDDGAPNRWLKQRRRLNIWGLGFWMRAPYSPGSRKKGHCAKSNAPSPFNFSRPIWGHGSYNPDPNRFKSDPSTTQLSRPVPAGLQAQCSKPYFG